MAVIIQSDSALYEVLHNRVFVTTFFGWFLAQNLKVFLGVVKEKRFNFKWFIGTGGMPSSHAAGVTALATSIGIQEGVGTAVFALSVLFALIVISDAHGVRWSTGKQAEVLNKMLDDIYWGKTIKNDKLKELIGHTPVEVIIGLLIGLTVAFTSYLVF